MQTHDELEWRETYFILFPAEQRPTLSHVDEALGSIGGGFALKNHEATEDGLFESILIESPENHAAVEISYETGDAVREQSIELAKMLKGELDAAQLRQLMQADARLDVMHFEYVNQLSAASPGEEEELDELFDPSCLLLAVDALVMVTGGIAIDPASGTVVA